MQKKLPLFLIIALMASVLSGCNIPAFGAAAPTAVPGLIETAVAATLAASGATAAAASTNTPVVIVVTATSAPTEVPSVTLAPTQTPFPTNTPLPSYTPLPTYTPLPSLTPVNTAVPIPCDRIGWGGDITVPDNTNFAANTTFVKTWRLKNTGACTWTPSYALVFESGNSMSGPAEVALPSNVAPGQSIDVSVTLKSPAADGSYQGFWKLRNASGIHFGLGNTAAQAFWVKITVGTVVIAPTTVTGSCSIVETIPAYGAHYAANADFDSRWKVKNTSGSTWSAASVDFKYLGGKDFYKNAASYDLAADVASGGSVDLIVDSTAPSAAGTYTMTWGLVSGSTTLCSMSVTIKVP
jgi:hypothetical protein